jgi:hypothetical protein
MAKQLEIQLKFTTKGATDLIEALKKLSVEQNKVSAAQRKFNNANLKAVTATRKLLRAEEKHRTSMSMKQRQMTLLNRRIEKLTFANQKLGISTGRVVKAQNRMRISTSGLQRMIGSIRNKILLVTFAFGGMAAGIRNSVQTSMQFEAVQVRLNSMFGSVERGTKAFNTFNKVAATTPFTLTDVVEAGAALKAFGTNAEEMIKPTADLAAFMGVTATEAAQSLGRAFAGGAGAADILRERGILQLIRDFKGIDDLSKISLPDFRKALEETLLDPEAGIAGATDRLAQTMTGLVSNMSDAFTRMSAALGDLVNMRGVVTTLTNAFSGLAKMFTEMAETELETTVRELGELGDAAVELRLEMLKIRMQQMELDAVEKQTTLDTNIIMRAIADSEQKRLNITKDLGKELLKLEQMGIKEGELREELATMKMQERVATGEEKILLQLGNKERKKEITNLLSNIDLLKKLKNDELSRQEVLEGNLNFATLYEQIQRQILGLASSITKETEKLAEALKISVEDAKILDEGEKLRLEMREQLFTDHFNRVFSIAQKSIDQQKQAELSALRDTDKFRNASAEERENMEKDALKKLQKKQNLVFKLNQANEIVKTVMSTMETAGKIKRMRGELIALGTKLAATPGGKPASARAFAAAAGLSAQRGVVIASGAAQAGLIAGQKPPAFARGGSFITGGEQFIKVGDNAGGRERVDITPLSSPDFGDAGGGTGVTVNIMGNVIGTQEFVRDSLLPEIEDSIRRNLA